MQVTQIVQNKPKRFYEEINKINDNKKREILILDSDESQRFQVKIWSKQEQHNTTTEWLCSLKQTTSYPQQEAIHFPEDSFRNMSKKMSN